MTDNGFLQVVGHISQADTLSLCHTLDGYAGHHRYHISHLGVGYRLTSLGVAFLPLLLKLFQFILQLQLLVAVVGSQLEVLSANGLLLFLLDVLDVFFFQRNLWRHLGVLQMHTRAYLVQGVDGLVGEEAVGDIAVCQFDTCFQCLVGIDDVMVLLVAWFDILKNLQRLLLRGGFNHHLLEAAFEGSIFLNRVAVFVDGRSADALNRASCKGWLHDVCGVHAARRRTGTDECVDFIDENDDIRILLQLL